MRYLLALLLAVPAVAATHTVSDSASLRHAVESLRDGDVLRLRPGVYVAHDMHVNASDVTIETEPGFPWAIIEQKPQPGGSRSIFIIDSPVRNVRFQRLILRHAWAGITISRDTLPRVSNVRIENCEMYGFEKSGVRCGGYGVEYLYMKGVRIHDCLGTEGGAEFRVNEYCYDRGAGSRFILIQQCSFNDNKHQQAAGAIFQESTDTWLAIQSQASGNGEQAFCSKAGGLNGLINCTGFNNGKCGLLYARDTWKIFKDRAKNVVGEIPGDVPTEYIVFGCVGVGRHYLSGDQGVVHLWPNVRVWLYQSTLLSLRKPDGAFTAAPLTVESAPDRASRIVAKNNILFRTTNGPLVNAYDYTELTQYVGVRNCYSSLDGRMYRTRLKKNAMGESCVEENPMLATPLFLRFNADEETLPHVAPATGSPVIRAGEPYGDGPDDWPAQAERLVKHWDEFRGVTVMNAIERGQLVRKIREAHLRDLNNRARDHRAPSIGALE